MINLTDLYIMSDKTYIVDMNDIIDKLNQDDNITKTKITKDEFVNNYIYKIMMPYILFLKIMLSDDKIYKKLKKNVKIDQKELNNINLYFLMELIKKQINN